MTRTAGARIGCQRPSRFWGLGCPKIYHEVEDTLVFTWRESTQWKKVKAGLSRVSAPFISGQKQRNLPPHGILR
ncbi:hypothetical protein [Thiolapillus sp.]|uniref:hypothetical protein n=1 Tax=Thiolapillus sp. TaxID=2017437 RepID=UPI003AF49D8B